MTKPKVYTRVYSPSSAGQLDSGKGPNGPPLTDAELKKEFRNHAKKWNRDPTALVSVSDRIVDTVHRAFGKYYVDREPPDAIWIAFIEVPDDGQNQPHRAKSLARRTAHNKPTKFTHERLFEWAIPVEYVSHQVSLKILMDRGLDWTTYLGQVLVDGRLDWKTCPSKYRFPSTSQIQDHIAMTFPCDRWGLSPWETGLEAGMFAEAFGARAPQHWIAHQLVYDCTHPHEIWEDVVKLRLPGEDSTIVDYRCFRAIDDGIDTAVVDWWLTSSDFECKYAEFKIWADILEDGLIWNDRHLTSEEWHAEHERIEALVEAEAVAIGL